MTVNMPWCSVQNRLCVVVHTCIFTVFTVQSSLFVCFPVDFLMCWLFVTSVFSVVKAEVIAW